MSDEKQLVQDSYLEQMVESAGKDRLLLMLVDGAVKFIRRALFAVEKGKLDEVHTNLVKAQNIYVELVISLDLDAGDFAENLAMVYQFLYNLLIEANMEKDEGKIRAALKLAEDIAALWKETVDKTMDEEPAMLGSEESDSSEALKQADPKTVQVKSTEIYDPAGKMKVIKAVSDEEQAPSRLNVTG